MCPPRKGRKVDRACPFLEFYDQNFEIENVVFVEQFQKCTQLKGLSRLGPSTSPRNVCVEFLVASKNSIRSSR